MKIGKHYKAWLPVPIPCPKLNVNYLLAHHWEREEDMLASPTLSWPWLHAQLCCFIIRRESDIWVHICNNKDDDDGDKHPLSASRYCASVYPVLPMHNLNLSSNDFMEYGLLLLLVFI